MDFLKKIEILPLMCDNVRVGNAPCKIWDTQKTVLAHVILCISYFIGRVCLRFRKKGSDTYGRKRN